MADRLKIGLFGVHRGAQAEPDPTRDPGQETQRRDRLQPVLLRWVRRYRLCAHRQADVIAHPDRLETGVLREARSPAERIHTGRAVP